MIVDLKCSICHNKGHWDILKRKGVKLRMSCKICKTETCLPSSYQKKRNKKQHMSKTIEQFLIEKFTNLIAFVKELVIKQEDNFYFHHGHKGVYMGLLTKIQKALPANMSYCYVFIQKFLLEHYDMEKKWMKDSLTGNKGKRLPYKDQEEFLSTIIPITEDEKFILSQLYEMPETNKEKLKITQEDMNRIYAYYSCFCDVYLSGVNIAKK